LQLSRQAIIRKENDLQLSHNALAGKEEKKARIQGDYETLEITRAGLVQIADSNRSALHHSLPSEPEVGAMPSY
jgi:hypothetical protein